MHKKGDDFVKTSKRFISLVLVAAFLMSMVSASEGTNVAAKDILTRKNNTNSTYSDPFATMYDSDEEFLAYAQEVLKTTSAKEESGDENFTVKSDLEDYMQTAQFAQIAIDDFDVAIEEEELALLEAEYEQRQTDRFIVKYKEGVASRDIGEHEFVSYTMDIAMAEGENNSRRRSAEASSSLELIVLDEKINPAVFADSLKDENFAQLIEYIQPDFLIEYAAIDLEIKEIIRPEIDIEEETKEEPMEPEQEEVIEDNEELIDETDLELEIPVEQMELREVIVALLDTGVDVYHEALEGRLLDGWNAIEQNGDIYDSTHKEQYAHGTHIAGIISQNSPEEVKILPIQVFGENGAYTSDIIAAIQYAQAAGASVVNCSFGSSAYNPALESTIHDSDMLFVTAAGNGRVDIEESPIYPAAFELDNILTVTCLNDDSGLSYFSNYSSSLVDIGAVGRNVVSALPENRYGTFSGTSMSAGVVSAAAGWVLSENGELTVAELKERLMETSDSFEHLDETIYNGNSLNIEHALTDVRDSDTFIPTPEEDFDVNGYAPTATEQWTLFSSKKIIQLAGGDRHTVALASDGTVWAWGANTCGQCGTGFTSETSPPVQVIGLDDVEEVAVGADFNLARKSDGSLWAWGRNNWFGYLGDGTTVDRYAPVQVLAIENAETIAAAAFHSMCLQADGTVSTWGWNPYGELGHSSGLTYVRVPTAINNLTDIAVIEAGRYNSFAVDEAGDVYGWGRNTQTTVGDGTAINRSEPVYLEGLSDIIDIAVGGFNTYAVNSEGNIWTWGPGKPSPSRLTYVTNVAEVSSNNDFVLFRKFDSTVFSWGKSVYGELGYEYSGWNYVVTKIPDLSGIASVATGLNHSFALKENGTIYAWGSNAYGQLGLNNIVSTFTPTVVSLPLGETPQAALELIVSNGETLIVSLKGSEISNLTGQVITIEYDPTMLTLVDVAAQTQGKHTTPGAIPNTELQITSTASGEISFTMDKNIPLNQYWTGVITLLKFEAIETGDTVISIS